MAFQLTKDVADQIKSLIEKRLRFIPSSIKHCLPKILQEDSLQYLFFATPNYLLITFLNSEDFEKARSFETKYNHPFPALVAENETVSAAFKVNGGKNTIIDSCSVTDMFAFAKSKDSTVLIQNHSQHINVKEGKPVSYKIKLAFLVFFGDEIKENNFLDYLDQLLAFSVNKWSSNCGK